MGYIAHMQYWMGMVSVSISKYFPGLLATVIFCFMLYLVVNGSLVTNLHPLQTPQLYCANDITDLQQVVEHIVTLLPTSPLMGVAVSMGRYMQAHLT